MVKRSVKAIECATLKSVTETINFFQSNDTLQLVDYDINNVAAQYGQIYLLKLIFEDK